MQHNEQSKTKHEKHMQSSILSAKDVGTNDHKVKTRIMDE